MSDVFKTGPFTGPEQRALPRCVVTNQVIYRMLNSPETYDAKTRDLSVCGVCLQIDPEQMLVDRHLKLTIVIPLGDNISVDGLVRWSRHSAGKRHVGVHFYEITTDQKEHILEYLYEQNKDEIVNHWFDGWNPRTT